MAFVNMKTKEVQAKIVYYGPGLSGKTSNLEYIHSKCRDRINSDIVSIKTHGDRTIYFDFIPFDIGKIKGFDVKMNLYTVPGQVKYNATRQLVLRGVDGIVFVADSANSERKRNLAALKNLQDNLAVYNKSIFQVPIVIQYNKRDLKDQGVDLLSVEVMEQDLNRQLKALSIEASAKNGLNVIPTLKAIVSETVVALKNILK